MGAIWSRWRLVVQVVASIGVTAALVAAVIVFSPRPDISPGQKRSPIPESTAPGSTRDWPLETRGSTIRDAQGQIVTIKAISWFGMETATCSPHGLSTISLSDGLAAIASYGFTTVRVPFSNECLASETTALISKDVNSSLVGLSPLELLDAVVDQAAAAGLTVILDRHRPGSDGQSDLWYTGQWDEARWISDWRKLARRYASSPAVIGVDLHNEPSGTACWACGDPARDWPAAATRAGNAVLKENPDLLVIVEGVENEEDGSSTWWGGGLRGVASAPVVLSVPNRVVYSTHDYPSSVHAQPWFAAADFPANLPTEWDTSWGYISQTGIAPVFVGEFGTRLESGSDRAWLSTLVRYLGENEMSFGWWAFNPDSIDTGGIVADDWMTPQQAKLNALAPLLTMSGLTGVEATPSAPAPASSALGSSGPTPSASVIAEAASERGQPAIAADFAIESSWADGYVAKLAAHSSTGAMQWTVSWPDATASAVNSAWGVDCTVEPRKSVTCTGTDWAASLVRGGSVTVGVSVQGGPAPASPTLATSAR